MLPPEAQTYKNTINTVLKNFSRAGPRPLDGWGQYRLHQVELTWLVLICACRTDAMKWPTLLPLWPPAQRKSRWKSNNITPVLPMVTAVNRLRAVYEANQPPTQYGFRSEVGTVTGSTWRATWSRPPMVSGWHVSSTHEQRLTRSAGRCFTLRHHPHHHRHGQDRQHDREDLRRHDWFHCRLGPWEGQLQQHETRRTGVTLITKLPAVIPHQDCAVGSPRSRHWHRGGVQDQQWIHRSRTAHKRATVRIHPWARHCVRRQCVFDSVFTSYGMTITAAKMEMMVFNDVDTHDSVIKLQDYQVKNAMKFSYLGYTLHLKVRIGSMSK